MPVLPLGATSNPARHPHAGVARLINVYAEQASPGGKVEWPLWAVSGLQSFSTLTGGGATRAMLGLDTEVLVVSNRVLFRVDAGGIANVVGGIASDGHVTMARNGRSSGAQVGIVCDGLYYIYETGTLTQINDADLQPPNSICYVGPYFMLTCPSGRVYITEIEDGTAIDALDFATAQASPDGLLVGKPRGRDAVLFGARSTEVWQQTGVGDFPFAPVHALNVGALTGSAVTEASIITGDTVTDTLIWVATDANGRYAGVCMMDGYTARKISTYAVDRAISTDATPSLITATAWTERGHAFVALSGTDWTWVYDTAGGWHERSSNSDRWRVAHVAALGQQTIAGDATDGLLYVLDPDTEDEDGDELVCTVQTPVLQAYPGNIEMSALYLDCVPGVGLATGGDEDVDPQVAMRWSQDGQTWSTERRAALGRQGATGTRVKWNRLGTQSVHGRSFQFRTSANVVRGIMQGAWDGQVLPP